MKAIETLARERTPEGDEIVLSRRDGVYQLSVAGEPLMTSRAHGSEEALARLACAALGVRKSPRVLIGGLGFGYTLRAALDCLAPTAKVVVCEVFACLLDWNLGILAELAGRPLADPRTTVVRADVHALLDGRERFDAILLDVDNGPRAFTLRSNHRLYGAAGLARLSRSLMPGGVLAVWSSAAAPELEAALRRAGFEAWSERVSPRGSGRRGHTIFLARKPSIRV